MMDAWDDSDLLQSEEIESRPAEEKPLPPGAHQFLDGTVVTLRPVPPLIVAYVTSSDLGKPPVPKVAIQRRGVTRYEDNPDDPAWQAAVAEWQAAKEQRLLKLFIERGVRDDVPPEVVDQYAAYLPPEADMADIKFMWLADKMADAAEVERFVEAVVTQTVPTEKGIAESEAAFPNHRER